MLLDYILPTSRPVIYIYIYIYIYMWLQIQRSLVRFPALPYFVRSNGLERGPLCLVSAIEELLGRNSQ
jgi:hypothetical protein